MSFKSHRKASTTAILTPFLLFLLIFTLLGSVAKIFNSTPGDKEGVIIFFMIFMCYGVVCYITFYMTISSAARKRFETLNKVLESSPGSVKVISSLHLQLCEVVTLLNRIFSIPLTSFLLFNMLAIVFSLYEGYAIMVKRSIALSQFGFCIQTIVLSVHYKLYVVGVVMASTMMSREAKKIMGVLSRVGGLSWGEKLSKIGGLNRRRRIFKLQLVHTDVQFSNGMFNFDWHMMHSVRIY
jgi:hypothetical protein